MVISTFDYGNRIGKIGVIKISLILIVSFFNYRLAIFCETIIRIILDVLIEG